MSTEHQQARILIVEDEVVVALDLKMQLQDMGYTVIGIADSGERALALAREWQPDLTLMDVRLKGAMDGVQAAAVMRQELNAPVIYLTSFSDPETVRRAAKTGPYGYLTKPFEIKELGAAIEVALYKSLMEQRLRESERWFTSTLRCVQDGVVITESDARVRFMNAAAEALTGWPMEEARGRPIGDLLHFSGATDQQTSAEHALHEGRVIGVEHARRLIARDGHEVAVDESAAPVDDARGHRLDAAVVLRDATERLRHEDRLRASEQRFRSAFDHAPLGMALVALDGNFIQVNDALCRLLNGDANRLKGCSHGELTHQEDVEHERDRLHELLIGGVTVVQFEKRYLPLGGGLPVSTLVSVSLLREGDDTVCYLYQVHDLTAQRKAAEQLAEITQQRMKAQLAEAENRAKNEFLSRMSHELRTPLNAVLGFAQLMKIKGIGENSSAAAYTEHILQAGQHLLMLVDDVLDLQRASAGANNLHVSRVSIEASVRQTQEFLSPLAGQYGVRMECEVEPGLHVLADDVRLRQVLLNVGSNAIKYNKPGGSLKCRTDLSIPGRVRLHVDDTGIGIAPEAMERLFRPFDRLGKERSPIPGTGLGLVIARSLMEQMGGSFNITSRLGEGTSVCLELPAA
ncbi:PAS domain S-box protein [Ideonella sp.]|uniref:PAS domain S-box protein n=1 Tax=Ideonella sp. TaxID=1929293 RepID=UPI0035AE8BCB